MSGVGPPPMIVGREREHAERPPDPVVQGLVREECAVAAVVLDHEQANQKGGGRQGQQHTPPVSAFDQQPGQGPQQREGQGRHGQLHEAPEETGRPVRAQARQQRGGCRRGSRIDDV